MVPNKVKKPKEDDSKKRTKKFKISIKKNIKKSKTNAKQSTKKSKTNAKQSTKKSKTGAKKHIKRFSTSPKGVVYLSRVPHGFYEEEMKGFFSQFGVVTAIRIPMSKRTGKFRGYAFVEFLYQDVAKIVAETMNNHLMFKKVLKAKYLEPSEQKPYAFKFKKFKIPMVVRRRKVLRAKTHRELSEKECVREKEKLDKIVQNKMKKLKKLGVNYEFEVNSA